MRIPLSPLGARGVREGWGSGTGAGGGEALEDAALVVEFGGDDAPGEREDKIWIKGALVLAEAGEAVVVLGGEEAAEEGATPGEELDGNAAAEEFSHGGAGELYGFAGDDAVEVAEGDFAEEFVGGARGGVLGLTPDFEAFAVEVDAEVGLVEAGGGHGGGGGYGDARSVASVGKSR